MPSAAGCWPRGCRRGCRRGCPR